MKVQCDVCSSEAASVFCWADEAALCGPCDSRIHSANKLATKHHRFSLLSPSPSQASPPLCDICQEKNGFLFCQQDRAILCTDCDASIHSANAHTMKHSRFLLAGISLSQAPLASPEADAIADTASYHTDEKVVDKREDEVLCGKVSSTVTESNAVDENNSNSSSSISEYLIKMLPGWHVEDFLFDDSIANSSSTSNSLSSSLQADELFPFAEGLPVWAHQSEGILNKEASNETCVESRSSRNKRPSSEAFKVPDFYYDWSSNKRFMNSLC